MSIKVGSYYINEVGLVVKVLSLDNKLKRELDTRVIKARRCRWIGVIYTHNLKWFKKRYKPYPKLKGVLYDS